MLSLYLLNILALEEHMICIVELEGAEDSFRGPHELN